MSYKKKKEAYKGTALQVKKSQYVSTQIHTKTELIQ